MRLSICTLLLATQSAYALRAPPNARRRPATVLRADESDDEAARRFDPATLSMRDRVSAYNRPPEDSALLSEGWKEAEAAAEATDDGPGLGAALANVGKALALVALLAAFSQVPLGKQDVSIPANDPTKVPITNFVKIDTS